MDDTGTLPDLAALSARLAAELRRVDRMHDGRAMPPALAERLDALSGAMLAAVIEIARLRTGGTS